MENKNIAVVMLVASFAGCLMALLVFAGAVSLVAFPLIDAAISQISGQIISEINSTEVTCSEYYIEGSIPVTVEDAVSYCILKKR